MTRSIASVSSVGIPCLLPGGVRSARRDDRLRISCTTPPMAHRMIVGPCLLSTNRFVANGIRLSDIGTEVKIEYQVTDANRPKPIGIKN
jgi:hypothetical protein